MRSMRIAVGSCVLAGMGWLPAARAQAPCAFGPPVSSYSAAPLAPSFSSIANAPGAVLVFGPGVDDTTSASMTLPAPFDFWGLPKTSFQVNNNGFIVFDQALASGFFTNAAPGTGTAPNDYVAPWWDDLHTGPAAGGIGSVWTQTLPGGVLAVEWNSMEMFPANLSGENLTIQLRLNPAPANTIEFHYDGSTFSSGTITWSGTIGVEDASGANGFDATGLGAANSALPATDLLLSLLPPGPPVPIPSYTATATPPSFSSIANAPGAVQVFGPGVDDTTSPSMPLPAPFDFWTQSKISFQVNNNGFVVFNQSLGSGFFTNSAPGNAATPNDYATPWWDDLHTGPSAGGIGSVWTQTLPGGVLAVEWNSMERFPGNLSGENVTIQLRLNPAPANTIEFHYDGASFSSGTITWSATVGAENANGTLGVDATGLGAANSILPASDFVLTPCAPCGATGTFGAPCPSTIGSVGGPPVSGNFGFAVTQSGATPGILTVLVLGISNTVWNLGGLPIPLPLPLSSFGLAGGCSLLVSGEILLPGATGPGGTSAFGLPIPPGLPPCSVTLYAQWANLISALPPTMEATNALTITIG